MKKAALLLLSVLTLIFPQAALASVSVEISGNGKGSTNTVNVQQSQSGSSVHQSSSSNIKTDIRVESNGEIKEYHSQSGGDIHVESSDGHSQVDVKNETTPSVSQSSSSVHTTIKTEVNGVSTTTGWPSSSPSASATPFPTPNIVEIEQKRFDLLAFLKKELESLNEFKSNLLKNIFG